MLSFDRHVQRAISDFGEAFALRKPVGHSPFAVPQPGAAQQPPAQQPQPQMPQPMAQMPGMPQPMAQMPGMAQGMPYQPPQQVMPGMPGMGAMSPYAQTNKGQPALRFAKGGSVAAVPVTSEFTVHRAKGGAWTRKEGQNPEGGLNAKGRASLRAQGHDIKPPVSAEQASKSPEAAGRRKSFCARMTGMPGPMKDDKGRPTRKALSLRKWDC